LGGFVRPRKAWVVSVLSRWFRALPLEMVKAAQAVPNPNQLTLDFEGRAAEKQKTRARAKASPVRKAPAGLDSPKKPGD
jgi:hypothetical protein